MLNVCHIFFICSLIAEQPSNPPHWLWPVVIGVGLTAGLGIVAYIIKRWWEARRRRKEKEVSFPFKPVEFSNLKSELSLTLSDNTYIEPMPAPSSISDDRILILGIQEKGKTRWAYEKVKKWCEEIKSKRESYKILLYKHTSQLFGATPGIPDDCTGNHIIFVLDDLPDSLLISDKTSIDKTDRLAGSYSPVDTIEAIIDLYKKFTPSSIMIIATARGTNVNEDQLHDFWKKDFKLVELQDISDEGKHNDLVRGMADNIDIKIEDDAVKALYEKNRGHSTEAIQYFLSRRKHYDEVPITRQHVADKFTSETHEQWRNDKDVSKVFERKFVEQIFYALRMLFYHYSIIGVFT